MKLLAAIEVTLINYAVGQTNSLPANLNPPASDFALGLEAGTVTTSQSFDLSTIFPVAPLTSTSVQTSEQTSLTATSLALVSTAISLSSTVTTPIFNPSETLILITNPTNAPTFTVASSPATSTAAAGTASGETGNDRVAVIALATILGALVIGLIILGVVLISRRRRRQANGEHAQNDDSVPPGGMYRRPASWLGSLSRTRSKPQYSSGPRQQYATTTSRPLMSEGSPRYGLSSPRQGSGPARYVAVPQSRADTGTTPTARSGQKTVRPDIVEDVDDTSPTLPIMGTARDGYYPVGQHERNTSDHDIGNPYVDRYPKTPELLQASSGTRQRQGDNLNAASGPSHHYSLTSHPVRRPLEMVSKTPRGGLPHNGKTSGARTSAIPREQYADAIAGLDIDPADPDDKDTSEPSVLAEPSASVHGGDQKGPSPSHSDASQQSGSRARQITVTSSMRRSQMPRLKIPHSLMPGRKLSKRTRFSMPGYSDVSPTSGSWHDGDETERGHGRRPSTISPVSSEMGIYRTRGAPHLYRPSEQNRPDVIDEIPHPDQMRNLHVEHQESLTPPPESARHKQTFSTTGSKRTAATVDQAEKSQRESALPQQARTGERIRRKPAPLDLATLIRKPLPPHPVPTSKFNQSARKAIMSQAISADVPAPTNEKVHKNSDIAPNSVHRKPAPIVPRSSTPTIYDQMVHGLSGMQAGQHATNRAQDQYKDLTSMPRRPFEPFDSNAIISSYLQPPSREVSQQDKQRQDPVRRHQVAQNSPRKRDTVHFFDDPSNTEHARVYGSYYSQPSPVQFKSPTSPHPLNPVAIPNAHTQPQQPQQVQLRPGDQAPASRLSLFPYEATYIGPRHGYAQNIPEAVPTTEQQSATQPPASNIRREPVYPEFTNQSSWRDSRQDAWRDSLSRSGSDHASTSVNNESVSGRGGTSSVGGGRTGLWGAPGYYGVQQSK